MCFIATHKARSNLRLKFCAVAAAGEKYRPVQSPKNRVKPRWVSPNIMQLTVPTHAEW